MKTKNRCIIFLLTLAIILTSTRAEFVYADSYVIDESTQIDNNINEHIPDEDISDEDISEVEAEETEIIETDTEIPLETPLADKNDVFLSPYGNTFSISTEAEWTQLLKKEGSFATAEDNITITILNDLTITTSTTLHADYKQINIQGGNYTINFSNTKSESLLMIQDNPQIEITLQDITFDGQHGNDSTFKNKFIYLKNSNLALHANNSTIQYFRAENYPNYYGGAIYLNNSELLLKGGIFEHNSAEFGGGAIYADNNSNLDIAENTIFRENSCDRGGGALYLYQSTLIMTDIEFIQNKSGYAGGALSLLSSALRADKITFTENSAGITGKQKGGAIYSSEAMKNNPDGYWSDNLITNSTFTDNFASEIGGAIFVVNNQSDIKYCDFKHNKGQIAGGAIATQNGSIKLYNSNFIENAAVEHFGGAIATGNKGFLEIYDSIFESNTAGIESSAGSMYFKVGGAIRTHSGAYITITDSAFRNNTAQRSGGALALLEGGLATSPTTLHGNNVFEGNSSVTEAGGAIHLDGAPLTIHDTTEFLSNHAETHGGAIESSGAPILIDGASTFLSNTAKTYGGAIGFDYGVPIYGDDFVVAADVVFNGNKADPNLVIFYLIDIDQAPHAQNIKTTAFSTFDDGRIFTQGFNNYDIGKYTALTLKFVNEDDRVDVDLSDLEPTLSFRWSDKYTLKAPTLTPAESEMFTFMGWDINGTIFNPGDIVTFASANIVAKAQWKVNIVLQLHANTGIFPENDSEILVKEYGDDHNSMIDLSAFTPVKQGYSLIGWDYNKNALIPQYAVDSTFTLPGNVELFAIWKKSEATIYTVTYKANGGVGELPADKTYLENSEVTLEANTLIKAKYTFIGWTIDGEIYAPGSKFILEKDTEVLATWKLRPGKPEPEDPDPETPGPETPGPETPGPETPGPETPGPETPGPEKPGPETPGPETPGPETPGPETPGPETPGPETPGPETPGPETPEPEKPVEELLIELKKEAFALGIVVPEKLTYEEAIQFVVIEKEKLALGGISVVAPNKDIPSGKVNPQTGEKLYNLPTLFSSIISLIGFLFVLKTKKEKHENR